MPLTFFQWKLKYFCPCVPPSYGPESQHSNVKAFNWKHTFNCLWQI